MVEETRKPTDWAQVILPLGKALGAVYDVDAKPGDAPTHFELHLGRQVVHLDREEWLVWSLAHADMPLQVRHQFTRGALKMQIETHTDFVERATELTDTLLDGGALAAVNFERKDERDALLRGHRLIPTAMGLGNEPEMIDRYWLALGGEKVVHINMIALDIWSESYLDGSIWQGIEAYLEPDGGPPFEGFTFDEVIDAISADLPAIIASGCGYLDPLS